jgi:putative Holliday junction resolvase
MSEPPFYDIAGFRAALPPKGRLVGLDVGETTIGIAVSDERRQIASPQLTITRRKWSTDLEALQAMFDQNGVTGIVIGYPKNMDGSEGARAQATRSFARNLRDILPLPILLWDERLSTMAVTRMMEKEADLSRARRDQLVDKLAASYLLQGALDALHANSAKSLDLI